MTKPTYTTKKDTVMDEIISDATELPLENQEMLLEIAKAMRYTKDCIMRKTLQNDIHN